MAANRPNNGATHQWTHDRPELTGADPPGASDDR